MTHPPIEDYALIGDCETAALVGNGGSIDWLCWPRFDSQACFAALIGHAEHGFWRLAPAGKVTAVRRRYRGETLVLETEMETAGGVVAIIDFMPVRHEASCSSDLVRIVVGRRGEVAMHMELVLRFDYGRIIPWVRRLEDGMLRAVAGPHATMLATPVELRGENLTTLADFTVKEGQRVPFVLTYEASHLPVHPPVEAEQALAATERFWSGWAGRCGYEGRWRDAVVRSLITIKALTYRPTGGIVAAPTTSLPEAIGGSRNWDYRFCWLRDSTLALLSLINAGYRTEAEAWGEWLLRAVAGTPAQVQPLYGVAGEHRLDERELEWLPGYRDSRPVRTGNAAYSQLQVDVFGGVMDTMHEAREFGLDLREAGWGLQKELVRHLEDVWRQPDEGIWEVRSEKRHFVHSKVMAWVAFDRAVRAVEEFGRDGPVEHWRAIRAEIHDQVCRHGVDESGAFVQSYGSTAFDAANLLIPLVGFLPPDDPRVRATTRAVERELMQDGLVLRYDTTKSDDGLSGEEGAFLACSFWFADNLILQGRRDEAESLFERLLGLRNDVGLLAEEYDCRAGAMVGNFPQAFSHLALIDTAFNFTAKGTAREASGG